MQLLINVSTQNYIEAYRKLINKNNADVSRAMAVPALAPRLRHEALLFYSSAEGSNDLFCSSI
jgi:hypothetical protein